MRTSDRPFFSICIPCFNHGGYIGKTIQSVLNQQIEDFEIVVADNMSSDDSRDVVRSFKDGRIRLIENRVNIGFAPNLQQVTRHARGRFINLLSSDDIMGADALSTYADLIQEYRQDGERLVLMSQAWEINGADRVIRYITKGSGGFGPVRVRVPADSEIRAQEHHEVYRGFEVFSRCMERLETAGMFCSVVYSRELWEAVEGYNSTQLMNPDKHFITKVLRRDPVVIYVNRPLYSYRMHELGQASQQARARGIAFQMDEYRYLLEYDAEWLKGTEVTREDQRRLFIDRDCLNQGLVELAEGKWTYASRLLAFAWTTYPGVVARRPKSLVLALLLLGGPVGVGVARVLRALYKMNRPDLPALSDVAGSPGLT